MTYIPTVTSSINWTTALDLDFTAQSSQTLGSDTNFTIAGLSWTKVNSANDATAMAITNGTGLVITPNSTSNVSNSTFSAPTLRIPITSVIPGFSAFMPIRIWIWESASNEAANDDQMFFGTYVPNASFQNQYTIGHWRGFQGSANGWGAQLTILNSNITVSSTSITPAVSNRVGVMYYPLGLMGGSAPLLTGSTVTAGAWPSLNSLTLTTASSITASSSAALTNSSSGAKLVSDLNFFICALRAGSGTAFSSTIGRFRVDYLPALG